MQLQEKLEAGVVDFPYEIRDVRITEDDGART